jgi:hypothetical protein
METLANLARKVGFTVYLEPRFHIRPEAQNSDTDRADALRAAEAAEQADHQVCMVDDIPSPVPFAHWDRRADILMLKGAAAFYVDVSITRPTCNSTLQEVPPVQDKQLLSTCSVGAMKHKKYDAIADLNRLKMVPFVMESYGGIGKEGSELLSKLAAHSATVNEKQWLREAHLALSCTLQHGNATISLIGQERLTQSRNSAFADNTLATLLELKTQRLQLQFAHVQHAHCSSPGSGSHGSTHCHH